MLREYYLEVLYTAPALHSQQKFKWQIYSTDVAQAWMKLLITQLKLNTHFSCNYTGFKFFNNKKILTQSLNNCIKLINESKIYPINEIMPLKYSQKILNVIHDHFEAIYQVRKSSFSPKLLMAIEGLNYFVHALEDHYKIQADGENLAFTRHKFNGNMLFPFQEKFYEQFKLDLNFGEVYLHYHQIGKSCLSHFLDQILVTTPSNVIPQNLLNAGFDVCWGEHSFSLHEKKLLQNYLINQNQDPENKKLCLGYLPLAKLVSHQHLDKKEIINLMSLHTIVEKIDVCTEYCMISSKTFHQENIKDLLIREFSI